MKVLKKNFTNISQQIIIYGIAVILVLMPFHAFLSVALGSLGLDRALVQSWKEILILTLAFVWIFHQLINKRIAFKLDATNTLFLIIVFLSLIVTLFIRPSSEAVLFGIKTNLVAITIFFIAQTPFSSKSFLKRNLLWIVLIPAALVSTLAIFQAFIISPETLEKIGYNATTINPRQIIDGSIDFLRSFSTLGGPNQLGAYLIVPLSFSISYGIRKKNWISLLLSILFLSGIILSFSRSAWIGAAVAIFLAIFLSINKKQKIYFSITTLILMAIAGSIVISQINTNQRLQNVLLHGRYFEGRIEGSDQGRLESVSRIADQIVQRPFGHGLGSAGPASFRSANPIIPENWYLQIAYEIGILGLMIYLFAFAALLGDFIRKRSNALAVSLFAATVGVLIVNLFLQTWADSTLALIVFTLYGIYKSRSL